MSLSHDSTPRSDTPASPVTEPGRVLGVVPNPARIAAEQLGERLQGLSAARTQLDHEFLIALAEFDASEGWSWFDGITSTSHWLSWACSIAPGTAREHVRVARALLQLPKASGLMAEGRLTYSKVREISRLVPTEAPATAPPNHNAPNDSSPSDNGTSDSAAGDHAPTLPPNPPLDEEAVCNLALEMTASQLARTVAAYRNLPGKRIRAEAKRSLSWRTRDDGLTELRVLLPADEAALVRAAIDTARSPHAPETPGTPEASETPENQPAQPGVDALLEVARVYLAADNRDPVDDHHLVTVLVDADTLAGELAGGDVPAGTSSRCEITGGRGIEAETARRLACDARILAASLNGDGEVLKLGRTKRVVSKAQRRALTIRDGHCQFPDCTRRHWLQAHHVEHWSRGGATDLPNLLLLCHFHHTCLHEGGITIHRENGEWVFLMPDGRPVRHNPPRADGHLVHDLAVWARQQATRPDPSRVFPPHGGYGFLLAECVDVLDRPVA